MSESHRGCILFATMEFYPTTPGGAGALIYQSARLLLKRGYIVVLLFDGDRADFEQLVNRDRLGIPFGHRLLVYLVADLCLDMEAVPDDIHDDDGAISAARRLDHALRKLTKIHHIDLIEICDFYGHGFLYLCQPVEDRPLTVVRLHSTVELIERKTRTRLVPERLWLYAMERGQLVLADAVLTPGMTFYDNEVRRLYPMIKPDRVLLSPPVHMPIGKTEYNPEARNIAFYGRLGTIKGLDTFLYAGLMALEDPVFAKWLDQFVVIGPEDHGMTAISVQDLRGLIPPGNAERFHFSGRLQHKELLKELHTVAIACFANRVESFCYAAHELHTAGIPLIVNRIAAFEDGFEDGVSAVFFDGTALDLAESMKRLARDVALRLQLSDYGKRRSNTYNTDHYSAQLTLLRHRRDAAGKATPVIGSAIVLSAGNLEARERTLSSVAAVPLQPFVLELDPRGEFSFAGSRWRGEAQAQSGTGPAELQAVGDACLFLRAGDVVEKQWVLKALKVLTQNPQVGAVGGWRRTSSGIESMRYVYTPEFASVDGPGLRVFLRTGASGQTLGEYLPRWGHQSEYSQLLAHRASGKVSVELQQVAADIRRCIDLPPTTVAASGVDFDLCAPEFLALKPVPPDPVSSIGGLDSDPDASTTIANPSLVTLRRAEGSAGELWVLRLRREDSFLELNWSAVICTGDWERHTGPHLPDAPAGVLMTRTGSMCFHTRGRTGIDLLLGPFCGICEIVHRGKVHRIDLKHRQVQNRIVWIDDLDKSPSVPFLSPREASLPASANALKPVHAALRSADIEVLVVAASPSSGIASRLRSRAGVYVSTPEDLGLFSQSNSCQQIAYALRTIRNAGCRKLVIDVAVPEGVELTERLIDAADDRQVVLLLGERANAGIKGAIEAYKVLGPWLRLAKRFPARLAVASRSSALITFFNGCGVPGSLIPVPPPALGNSRSRGRGEIEVIVLAGSTTVASTAHMIMAVAHARNMGLRVVRLWLPKDDNTGPRVARTFATTLRTDSYENLDAVFYDESPLRIGLCVFPDDELPEAAEHALAFGALPILGPVSMFAADKRFRETLCVTYWEDAEEIADALLRTVRCFDILAEHYQSFRLERAKESETALDTLLA